MVDSPPTDLLEEEDLFGPGTWTFPGVLQQDRGETHTGHDGRRP